MSRVRFARPDPEWLRDIEDRALAGQCHPEAGLAPRCCSWCGHPFHGRPCSESVSSCGCDSSLHARDDSWRPVLLSYTVAQCCTLMDATGCDGWVATAAMAAAPGPFQQARQFRIRSALRGQSRPGRSVC